jgi:hypothetical protein
MRDKQTWQRETREKSRERERKILQDFEEISEFAVERMWRTSWWLCAHSVECIIGFWLKPKGITYKRILRQQPQMYETTTRQSFCC